MKRIKEASERVSSVTELKTFMRQLIPKTGKQRHGIVRGLWLYPEKLYAPTADLPLPPSETLAQARERLLHIFQAEFAKASQVRDSANTSRFFKLFPAIGWEKEGLEAYSEFVVDLVRGRATVSGKSSSPLYYIQTLTSLFESIALIVDQHQPLVEKYYGPRKMLSVVERLLQECDRVVGGLIESWEEERQMQRKIQDTGNAYFSALAPTQQRKGSYVTEEDGPDPREVDRVLTEVAGMAGRWALFRRFLIEHLKEDNETPTESPKDVLGPLPDVSGVADDTRKQQEGAEVPPEVALIESCGCRSLIDQLMRTYYIPLETWYLRSVIDKAGVTEVAESL
ncbi:hypothetical protein FRB99_003829 [Tulasnella sp. 403]|nr:hypothetical protein FRB99_003829 [Tulasnella sp. 403]